ncbi:mitochondrial inner membrane protease subunit Imp2 [Penicillium odoratum]|uniref:mitochondrial inner membrane protease subunit Imp2 n=1 Tax=Penicillium odoratum TaxID=1167516 RepID=UPI0025489EFB|nr:mitochondrial inner membrane protease subunit Imp2 [Penicillium odoratum]KAJ5758869.1 mitochondrial inner membrane protease subunit Imp2 [Penicillium odoratum]
MPPQKPQSQPQPKQRILNPQAAKLLAQEKNKPEFKPIEQQYASLEHQKPLKQGSPLVSKWHLPSAFSRLRQRYATLPSPIRRTCRILRVLAPIIPISLFFSEHVAQIMWVRGPSMTPYLNEDYDQMQTKCDMVLVNMWPWGPVFPWARSKRIERGMIVTFRSPANSSHIAIKRVVGLPGDRITTREPCMKPTQIVPFNHVWLEGDAEDPRKTLDSNTYGPVSISLITGRVLGILGPRMRWLNWEDWETGKSGGPSTDNSEENYRQSVRDRVVKEAVKLERPDF